jgi:hypothetical protein
MLQRALKVLLVTVCKYLYIDEFVPNFSSVYTINAIGENVYSYGRDTVSNLLKQTCT